jgi:hypothetical protein
LEPVEPLLIRELTAEKVTQEVIQYLLLPQLPAVDGVAVIRHTLPKAALAALAVDLVILQQVWVVLVMLVDTHPLKVMSVVHLITESTALAAVAVVQERLEVLTTLAVALEVLEQLTLLQVLL